MPANDSHWTQLLEVVDDLRRAQGNALQLLGLGPDERSYRITASGTHWRVRDYADQEGGPTVLIVAAPIKRPYIWDIAPSASAIGYCLRHGVRVHLIEWLPPRTDDDDVELNDYADAIANAVAAVAERSDAGAKPFLMGHSLGGTLAAMYAALEPGRIQDSFCWRRPSVFGAASVLSATPSFRSYRVGHAREGSFRVHSFRKSARSLLPRRSCGPDSQMLYLAWVTFALRKSMRGLNAGPSTRCRSQRKWRLKSSNGSIGKTVFVAKR